MKNKKKNAFTMIEILIVFVIIGFILVAELIILNSKSNEYGNPYYTIYNSLKKTSYNVLADLYCPGSACPNTSLTFPRQFPTNGEDLCKRFAEFLNVSENHCEGLTPINDAANNIDTNNPHLVLSNSYRMYFGDEKLYTWKDSSGISQQLNYFVVYVDLNGEKAPNRLTCKGTKVMPDIVPFAITRRGETIPMGYPVYSKLYITAKISYPSISKEGTTELENKTSGSMSFYDAIYGAWPSAISGEVEKHIDIPFSLMFSDEDDFIKANSNIRQCYDGREPELKPESEYKAMALSKESEGCKGGTYNCRVIVDSTTTTRY